MPNKLEEHTDAKVLFRITAAMLSASKLGTHKGYGKFVEVERREGAV